jgi:type IV secretion system protein VirD4
MGTVFLIFGLFVVGALGIKLVTSLMKGNEVRDRKNRLQRGRAAARAKVAAGMTTFTSAEEITEFFKNKENIISSSMQNHPTGSAHGYIVSRALSTMTEREANALYYSETFWLLGYIDEQEAKLVRTQMIYNGGNCEKTIFSEFNDQAVEYKEHELLAKWMGNATVQTGITTLLNAFAKIEAERKDDPLIREFRTKIIGGNRWSDDATLFSSPAFAEQDEMGLFIGATEAGNRIVYRGEGSLITIAPTGAGKTQCHVFPTLLSYRGAAIVLDVKGGECFAKTAEWRKANVGPVLQFNPFSPRTSARYNPLAVIEDDPETLWEDCGLISELLIVPESQREPFWEQSAQNLLTGIIAWLVRTKAPEERRMGIVMDILSNIGWDGFIGDAREDREIEGLRRVGEMYADMEAKQRDGIVGSAKQHLKVWEGDRTSAVTAKCDWMPEILRDGRTTIYISIPLDGIRYYAPLLRVMFTQHLRRLCRGSLAAPGEKPILFMLDELPRLGAIPPVAEAVETGRAYGVRLWMFFQNLGQLKESFTNPDGVAGNCAVRIFMNPDPQDGTNKRLSEELGEVESIIDKSRHPMVRPEALSGPDYADFQIMIHRGMRPAKLQKVFAWQEPEFAERMKAEALSSV